MGFMKRRRQAEDIASPGLMPIDNINAGNRNPDVEPDSHTGLLPAQEGERGLGGKRRRATGKKSRRKSG